MANATAKKILLDGPQNAVVQLTGILDTANASLASAIATSDFSNNRPLAALRGFRIQKIVYSVGSQLQLQLEWSATADEVIAALAGQGEFCYEKYGGLTPTVGAAGFDGAIDLVTTGWASGIQNYTVLLYMTKLYTV